MLVLTYSVTSLKPFFPIILNLLMRLFNLKSNNKARLPSDLILTRTEPFLVTTVETAASFS